MRIICTICRRPPYATRMEEDGVPKAGDRCERDVTDDVRCSGKYINALTDADKEQRGQINLLEIL